VTQLEQILDLARWAPSGDNTQPWRFQILSDRHVAVHAFDTREHCVYDLDGHASQLSVGALLETMRIAATGQGLATRYRRRLDAPEARPVFDVTFDEGQAITRSPLIDAIRARTVQRRPLKRRGIRPEEKTALESSLPAGYSVIWLEGARRWHVARLLFLSAKIRLTTREAYEVHRKVLHWNAQFSEDRIPDQAVGLDPLTLGLMRWAMQDWRRVWILNTFFAGTVAPRLQLDLLPALACGAHLAILVPGEPASVDDYVTAGAAVQRLWLTATSLGLQHQPEITPLIFSRYARTRRRFTENARAKQIAISVADRLEGLVGKDAARRAIWLGRLGAGQPARARSTRLPLDRLLLRG
jgi:nitroreductase